MKPIYLLSALFFFSLRAQGPVPVPLAHGDVPGEPHHHLKIENAYVRAYYVEVPPHDATQLHQHDHDYIFVTLGDSDVTNAVLGKPEAHLQLKDGEVRFTRGGFAHVARNNSDAPFRNVTIEFLRPQGEARNLCEKIIPGDRGRCVPERRRHVWKFVPWFETAEAYLGFVQLEANAKYVDYPVFDRLFVSLQDAEIKVEVSGKPPVPLGPAPLAWLPSHSQHTFINPRSAPSRFLLLSFKDSAAPR